MTPQTLTNERAMLARFAGNEPINPVSLDERYELKWAMKTNDKDYIEAWVACAIEATLPCEEPMMMVPMKKWNDGSLLHKRGGKPFLLVAERDEQIIYVRHDEVQDSVVYGIGSCAGDHKGIPCVLIPSRLFRIRTETSPDAMSPSFAAAA